MQYETTIGLEVHLQLNTKTKIFCGCANVFGSEPNANTCPVCLGLPGTLPVLNKQALLSAVRVALALNCAVNPCVKFDRKNYYYPDLPKGYQISQFDLPIAHDGYLNITTDGTVKKIRIRRAHLEEDAGKLMHDQHAQSSLVDYNRTGTPLIEIVTEPDLASPQEAHDYLTNLKLALEYLEVSDCDMEKGSLRCDANISIRPVGQKELGTKTELKNMNSFRAVKVALEHEIERHKQVLISGHRIVQETRLWNEQKQSTATMRSKEEAHDYRYFPEPDLVPFVLEQRLIDSSRSALPESPTAKLERFKIQYSISEYDAQVLVQDKYCADFFESCVRDFPQAKKVSNWMSGPLLKELKDRKVSIRELGLRPKDFIQLIQKVDDQTLSNLAAKDVLNAMLSEGKNVLTVISERGLTQVSDTGELDKIIDEIFLEQPGVVEQILQGKETAKGFIIGQAMKKSKGKANPKLLGELIQKKLNQGFN